MSDEQKAPVTVEEPQAPTEATPADLAMQWLASASPDEIMKHDRIKGIFGNRLQIERDRIRKDLSDEQDRAAREKAEADLLELARYSPDRFAEKYLTDYEQKRIANDVANMKRDARLDFAKQLGAGYSALPEWKNLTPTQQEQLARSVAGKTDDEAIVSFNAAALDVIAEIRAEAKLSHYRETELPKEREAARQEAAAQRLKQGARPTLTRASVPTEGRGWQDLPPGSDFNKEYERNVLGRRR